MSAKFLKRSFQFIDKRLFSCPNAYSVNVRELNCTSTCSLPLSLLLHKHGTGGVNQCMRKNTNLFYTSGSVGLWMFHRLSVTLPKSSSHKSCMTNFHTALLKDASTSFKSGFEICPVWKRSMAGHSKWQNIKHTKEAKDREKALIFQKFAFQIRRAVIENGGPDPKLNSKLANIIKEARTHNVPSSTIETAIKRAVDVKLQAGVVSFMGPNGSCFIVELETDNMSRTMHGIKQLLKRTGCMNVIEESRAKLMFDYKGIIRASALSSGEKLNKEKAVDLGIEAGAEDVVDVQEDNQDAAYEFVSSSEDFLTMKKALEKSNVKLEEASLEYIPKESITLDQKTLKLVQEFCNSLEDMQEVVRVFDNIKL